MQLGNDWDLVIGEEFQKTYYRELRAFLKSEYFSRSIYPDMYHIFQALKLTPYQNVKAVILGQDPYHGEGQAHGLCFSVQDGIDPPPSLQNIFKELQSDIGMDIPTNGNLTAWAQEGVLLLNTTLTVRAGAPLSHTGKGWEIFTDTIIQKLNASPEPIVFLLWGSNARSKKQWITSPKHLVLECAHPSPLSAYRGFFGCRHFSKTNAFLISHGRTPIAWDSILHH